MVKIEGFIEFIDKDGNAISFHKRNIVYVKRQSDGDIEVRTSSGVEIVKHLRQSPPPLEVIEEHPLGE